jgi:orotidine-5'-phosphate decarboxylase
VQLFRAPKGIIVACDVDDLATLATLVSQTTRLEFIVGYKVGMLLVVKFGIARVIDTIRNRSSLTIIYDHQKFGTDIPELCSGRILKLLKEGGVDALIIFPLAGIETLKATVRACLRVGLVPIIGGEMTHKGYLESEGGYLADNGPIRIYGHAAVEGVRHYVVPGTKLRPIKRFIQVIESSVAEPEFLFPGVGSGQGGDIAEAFKVVWPHKCYAIVGRGIYGHTNPCVAAKELWARVEQKLGK